jgi:hypothetical protein
MSLEDHEQHHGRDREHDRSREDRAERQVAKLRGDAMQPSSGNIPPTAQPAPDLSRGGSRVRPRVEPVLSKGVLGKGMPGTGVLGLRKGA